MPPNREQKILDIMCECVNMVATDPYLRDADYEKRMEWVRRQLTLCGIDTEPMGASWARLK